MFIPFEELNAQSRVWIYTGSRALTEAEGKLAEQMLHSFCEQWSAHGQPLQTSFKVEKNQFIAMALDENFESPSGCSIDSSVGVLRKIQIATGVDFLDRSKIPFLLNDSVELIPLSELKARFSNTQLTSESLVINSLSATKGEWGGSMIIPAKKSWLVKYLPKTALTS